MTPVERLKAKYTVNESGCWVWNGCKNHKGYGQFWFEGTNRQAHRVAYALLVGDLIPGMLIDHTCHNRACINPDHLQQVTIVENGENRAGTRAATGYRGVASYKGKYQAYFHHHKKKHHLGVFPTAEEAAEAARIGRLQVMTNNLVDRRAASSL